VSNAAPQEQRGRRWSNRSPGILPRPSPGHLVEAGSRGRPIRTGAGGGRTVHRGSCRDRPPGHLVEAGSRGRPEQRGRGSCRGPWLKLPTGRTMRTTRPVHRATTTAGRPPAHLVEAGNRGRPIRTGAVGSVPGPEVSNAAPRSNAAGGSNRSPGILSRPSPGHLVEAGSRGRPIRTGAGGVERGPQKQRGRRWSNRSPAHLVEAGAGGVRSVPRPEVSNAAPRSNAAGDLVGTVTGSTRSSWFPGPSTGSPR
jgi:hypothetical protein